MSPALSLVLAAGLVWAAATASAAEISLPRPSQKGPVSVEEALASRRTVRSYAERPLSLEQTGQLLWSAYGVTGRRMGRALKTAPSAGATYPLDIYLLAGRVEGLEPGAYLYLPREHALRPIREGDRRRAAARAALGQMWAAEAPAAVVIAAVYGRCTAKYGPRGEMYTQVEAGCAAQNLFLQAQALGLEAGIIGALEEAPLRRALGISGPGEPLLLMPLGHGR